MPSGRKLSGWTFHGLMGKGTADARRDEVRVEVGDCDPDFNLIEDAVIKWRLSQEGDDVMKAAYRVAGDIKARFAKYTDKSGTNYNEALSQVYDHYKELQEQLKTRRGLALPQAPQISKDRREELVEDDDLKQPDFTIGMLSEDTIPIRSNVADTDDPWRDV